MIFNCTGCHTLDPAAGFFGGDGCSTFEGETQAFKVPHLHNVYQKVGMFGSSALPPAPQVRGFGFLHDGSVDTVFNGRINQMINRDTTAEECEVVVKGTIAGEARGAYLTPAGVFQLDRVADAPLADADLRALAAIPGQELTYTCAPFGSGERMGVDRDEDGHFDRDELDAGSDPAHAASIPLPPTPIRASSFGLRDDDTVPVNFDRGKLSFKSSPHQGVSSGVVVPPPGSTGDPTIGGAVLRMYGAGGGDPVTLSLPAARWLRIGSAGKPAYKYADKRRESGPSPPSR